MIYRAPGKVVLWGEYAVLDGAPAAVMAVDRFAEVNLTNDKSGWQFTSSGFLTPGMQTQQSRFSQTPAASMAEAVLSHWGANEYPQPFHLHSDSTLFYDSSGAKLGIGSSAAVCTATYVALANLLGKPASVEEATLIHRNFQHGKGSGLDVASSWHGGIIRFQNGRSNPLSWSDFDEHEQVTHWQVVWTGTSSATDTALGSFSTWLQQAADTSTLTTLGGASLALTDKEFSKSALQHYIECLRALDEAAKLHIFTPQHARLATIASAHGLIYKPCGAGGGDIGIAFGDDPAAVEAFKRAASNEKFVPLDLETANHGVKLNA